MGNYSFVYDEPSTVGGFQLANGFCLHRNGGGSGVGVVFLE